MTGGERALTNRHQRGFGYLTVLFALATMGLLLAGAGQVWHTVALREKEAQLLFIGQQFRLALASYRDSSPVGAPTAPASLDELLSDRRHPVPKPHLRKVWRDPMTNTVDWGLLRTDGRIVGVHSRSELEPLRSTFAPRDEVFADKSSYAQWIFSAVALQPDSSSVLPEPTKPQ